MGCDALNCEGLVGSHLPQQLAVFQTSRPALVTNRDEPPRR